MPRSQKSVGKKPERGQWDRPVEFFLACVGYAVGVGNVWRFPYLCYKNGGAVFLIPYVISLLVAGIPIFYLELALGQFSSLGPTVLFERLSPIFSGIGWGMVVVTFITGIFYNMLLAWIIYYFFTSIIACFKTQLPWASCSNEWNTHYCHSNIESQSCVQEFGEGFEFFNKTCVNASQLLVINETLGEDLAGNRTSPGEEFFEREVLNISDSFEKLGGLQWKLVLCLLAAWILILLFCIKGVKSTGKVVYFTATFPYVVLIILLVRGLTLDGAIDGIRYYIIPDVSKLNDITVWKDAATQIFFSLSTAFGGLLTMASYNKFHNNCFRDAILVSLINCGTSFFAGFAVFSIAGFMAQDLNVKIDHVVRDGIGLAFIAYPEAISRMPISQLWAILFFFMLFLLGIDSMMVFVETVTTGLQDQFPVLMRHRFQCLVGTSLLGFLFGLPLCSRSGIYIFTLLNDMAAGYSVLLLAICELIAACWLYGIRNLFKDIQMMLGISKNPIAKLIGPTGFYWAIIWGILAPVFLTAIVVLIFVFYKPSTYGRDYTMPMSAQIIGWVSSALSIGLVPLFAIYKLLHCCCKGKPISSLFKATIEWCPADQREKRKDLALENERKRAMDYPGTSEYMAQNMNYQNGATNHGYIVSEPESIRSRYQQVAPEDHGYNSMAMQIFRHNTSYNPNWTSLNHPEYGYPGYGNMGYTGNYQMMAPAYHVPYGTKYKPIYVVNGYDPQWIPIPRQRQHPYHYDNNSQYSIPYNQSQQYGQQIYQRPQTGRPPNYYY